MSSELLIGIDVGTQGARVVASDPSGMILAQADRPFPLDPVAGLPAGWIEQLPGSWWKATASALRDVMGELRSRRVEPEAIAGISVTSTSGTVVVVDRAGDPVGGALMYNDRRAEAEAAVVNQAGAALAAKLGYSFASSFALPKILWLRQHDPSRFEAAHRFLSPTDFIIGRLTGVYDVTDYTNALKTGYDLVDGRWPEFIESDLGIEKARLPRVVAPGTRIGEIPAATTQECRLAEGTPVFAGMTDGCASQISTGAVAPGQWNSTLGTTLVIKGVSHEIIRDPAGRVYCHKHPDGFWLPGGASNSGGEAITRTFGNDQLAALDAAVQGVSPTNLLAYPLAKPGERFPFVDPEATGFIVGEPRNDAEKYAAYLEGIAYVERLAYDVLTELGAPVGNEIHAAGGATKSNAWLQVRADVLQKAMVVPAEGGGAMGAAILAAGGALHPGVIPAAKAMVRVARTVEPRPALKAAYDERYGRFVAELRRRNYLK